MTLPPETVLRRTLAAASLLAVSSVLVACGEETSAPSAESPAAVQATGPVEATSPGAATAGDGPTSRVVPNRPAAPAGTSEPAQAGSAQEAAEPADDGAGGVDIEAIRAELAGVPASEVQARAEELWAAGEYEAAVELSRTAYADDRNRTAAYRLGTAYFTGNGVERDLDEAWTYLSIPELDETRFALYYRGLVKADPAFAGHDVGEARSDLERARALGVEQAQAALDQLPAAPPAGSASGN